MNIRRSLIAAALAAAIPALPAAAQAVQPAVMVAPGNTLLSLNAEGKTFREPDLAVFSAGVTTQGSTAVGALSDNSRAMTRVIDALKRAGIADKDIQTSTISVNPIYADPNRFAAANPDRAKPPVPTGPVIVGYQASNTVSIRQRDLKSFGTVIDTLASAGANQINGPAFQLDNPAPALDEARLNAVKTARARAELYANATGLRIVRIVSLTEDSGSYGPPPMAFARRAAMQDSAAPAPPVEPGELQQTINLSVVYELAPR
ncbi:MAG: SIMPL domain-containing protein [Croceibacterium sp.]